MKNGENGRLLPACFATGRSLGYKPCLLGLTELNDTGMSVWSNKKWETGTLLDLEFFDSAGSSQYLTCAVQDSHTPGQLLGFYKLSFFDLKTEALSHLKRLFGPRQQNLVENSLNIA